MDSKGNCAYPAETPVLVHPPSATWKPVVWLLCHALGPLINGSEGTGYERWQKWASGPDLVYTLIVEWKRACHIFQENECALWNRQEWQMYASCGSENTSGLSDLLPLHHILTFRREGVQWH